MLNVIPNVVVDAGRDIAMEDAFRYPARREKTGRDGRSDFDVSRSTIEIYGE